MVRVGDAEGGESEALAMAGSNRAERMNLVEDQDLRFDR